ncbi:hypothetical protein [Maribellus maritimus]|uniref:hypothetical protein n=1 Tax=Maribellus maritimus TaxID=2870838 RepID=UPI001EEB6306|nr:hypothetical protein [Maribellus maritimus]MCG6188922.1 hypothetical protein [Maribellus maritimus]
MIKFFRRIRQRLITEKKISNYLLYAFGEIILVVIGILIALAINNSNQKRIIREKEQVYLIGLKNEFQTSKSKLQRLIEVNNSNFEGAKKIVEYISDENIQPDESEFSELLYNTFAFDIAFNPNNSLLNEMINSGSLKDISNPILKTYLTTWISTLEDIAKQENDLGIQREKVLDMFRKESNSIRTIFDLTDVSGKELGLLPGKNNISNLNLLNSKEFENNILIFILTTRATESTHYNPLMEELDAILGIIDEEIKG